MERRSLGPKACVIVVVAILAAALAAPAAFGVLDKFEYAGHVKGDAATELGFQVKKTDAGHRRVVGFTVDRIPYSCSDAPDGRTGVWMLDDRMRVRSDRTFEGSGDWVGLFDPVGPVSGKLRRGGVAVGDFRVRGELAGDDTHCHTGLLEWRAIKPS